MSSCLGGLSFLRCATLLRVSDPIGRLVAGKYRIRRKLGKGGFGAVYEAEHVEIQKRVAIKTIDKAHAAVPERVARF